MRLSSIILSWNRKELLEKTIDSYLATAPANHELIVVDNASTDGAREYLEQRASRTNEFRLVLMPENLGGKAVNSVLPDTSGELVQFIENDQVFLPGWFEYTEKMFALFPELGQLSLFAPVPTDDEAWEAKASHLMAREDDFLYQAHANCGFSSVHRSKIFREHGVTIENVATEGSFQFPNDAKLSQDVKALGYFCAYSKRYFVQNVGHFVEEFQRNESYYEENYASKHWLGIEGWKDRIQNTVERPKPARSTFLFPDESILPEKTNVPVGTLPPSLWSMLDGFTAEVEVLEFLYSLTRLIKPEYVLETGTWRGYSACAIGQALSQNGFGTVDSLELDEATSEVAKKLVESQGLSQIVNVINCPSTEFTPSRTIQFALLDSDLSLRHLEFLRYLPAFAEGAVVCFHDVAPHHGAMNENVKALIADGYIEGLFLPTPRGLFVGKVKNSSLPH